MPHLIIRPAAMADLPALVALLADDPISGDRDDPALPLDRGYAAAFAAIAARPDCHLMVATDRGEVVGVLQLTFVPGLIRKGAWRAYVEGVFVRSDRRSQGIGARLIAWAADTARARGGCPFLQLTSNKGRLDAHRFYERLGFQRSSEGFKLLL
jgi:GNAT superfamily N-acetyltransferase